MTFLYVRTRTRTHTHTKTHVYTHIYIHVTNIKKLIYMGKRAMKETLVCDIARPLSVWLSHVTYE